MAYYWPLGSHKWRVRSRCGQSDCVRVDTLAQRGLVPDRFVSYFLAAAPSSIERNLYSAVIPRLSELAVAPGEPTPLTDSSQMSYYSASFSPQNGFYVLSYLGPNIPYQQVIEVDNKGMSLPWGFQ